MPHVNRGFSLLEVAIILGILSLVAGISMVFELSSYHHARFNSDRDALRTALMHARLEALYGVCAASSCTTPNAHGVYVASSSYIVFEGATYAEMNLDADEVLDSEHDGMGSIGTEIDFNSLSAAVEVPRSIVLRDSTGRTSTTSVNSEGAITETL